MLEEKLEAILNNYDIEDHSKEDFDIRKQKAFLRENKETKQKQKASKHKDIISSRDQKDAISLIQEFANTFQNLSGDGKIYQTIKEYCKTRENRQLLIQNDFHLYLRDAYRSGYDKEQIILEIIYSISLEEDFCDEVALLGEMADEAFIFLQTHMKSYNKSDGKGSIEEYHTYSGDTDSLNHHNIEIIDSPTLLKLDLWVRVLHNFCKNEEVLDYIVKNKVDVLKYLLLFLQNIDSAIKQNPNLSSINSIVIASTVKNGVLDILFLLSQMDEIKQKIISSEAYFSALYTALQNASNQSLFTGLCKLMSQLAISKRFPINIFGDDLIRDYLFTFMTRTVYNVGLSNEQSPSEEAWNQIQSERDARGNYLVELGLARTFCYLALNQTSRKQLVKTINQYADSILVRFLYSCFEKQLIDASLYMILGLIQLVLSEGIKISKQYQKKVILFMLEQSEKYFDEKNDKKKMSLSILLIKLARLINWSKEEAQQVMDIISNKLSGPYQDKAQTQQQPKLKENHILTSIQTKKKKKYEQREEEYYQQRSGYDVQGMIIRDKDYGMSVEYSQLLSDLDENDFDDSLDDEEEIYHIRKQDTKQEQINLKKIIKKNKNSSSHQSSEVMNADQSSLMFTFQKDMVKSRKSSKSNSLISNTQNKNNQQGTQQQKQSNENNINNNMNLKNRNSKTISLGNSPFPAAATGSIEKNQNSIANQFENASSIKSGNQMKSFNNPNIGKKNLPTVSETYEDLRKDLDTITPTLNNEENAQLQYLNRRGDCYHLCMHSNSKCEFCQSISASFFNDKSSNEIEQWMFDAQNGKFDEQMFQVNFRYESVVTIIHTMSYLAMNTKGEVTIQAMKGMCSILSNINKIYDDDRYQHLVMLFLLHCMTMNDSIPEKLLQIQFLGYQDYILTQLLNSFGYKQFCLLELIERGDKMNNNPIFQQVLRRNSKNLTNSDDRKFDDLNKDNIYEKLVIQSTLKLQYDGKIFSTKEVVLNSQDSIQFIKSHLDQPLSTPLNLCKFNLQFQIDHCFLYFVEKYTTYYLQLHSVQHTLESTYKIFKKALKNKDVSISSGAAKFLDQFVYLLLFFSDLNKFEQPQLPFYPETTCWEQNKVIIGRCFSCVVRILKLLILRKSVLKEYSKIVILLLFFLSYCMHFFLKQKQNPHLLEIIRMAELFPQFKGSLLLFSVVYAVQSFKQSSNEEFVAYDLQVYFNQFYKFLFLSFSLMKCFIEGLQSASEIQNKFSKVNSQYFTANGKQFRQLVEQEDEEKKMIKFLKFHIICLQFFCCFSEKQILNSITNKGKDNLKLYLSSVLPVLEFTKKLEQLRLKKQQILENQNVIINGRKLGPETENENEQDNPSKSSIQELVANFQSSLLLLFSNLAEFKNFAELLLGHPTLHYIVRNVSSLFLSPESQFCLTSSLHSLTKTMVTLENIQKQYITYSKDVSGILYEHRIAKNNLMPLFRSVRFLLQQRREDCQYFREMIPKLREFSEISNVQPIKKMNQLGKLEISAITSNDMMIPSGKGSSAQPQDSFMDKNSLMSMMEINKKPSNSFLDNVEITFLQNMKGIIDSDERESAIMTLNESIQNADNQKMNDQDKREYFKDLFQKEARLLLKMLVLVSENELQQQIKEMKLNKEFKITEAGTLSKKTQKQNIDLEEKKKALERPLVHDESKMYGLNIKEEYKSPLGWIPDYYKKSATELYDMRMKERQRLNAINNEPIPVIKLKDDSDSTMYRIEHDQTDALDRKPDFLQLSVISQNKNKGDNGQDPSILKQGQNILDRNNQNVESLQQFMKEQKQIKQQQKELDKSYTKANQLQANNNNNNNNLLPLLLESSSLSSIHDQIKPLGSHRNPSNNQKDNLNGSRYNIQDMLKMDNINNKINNNNNINNNNKDNKQSGSSWSEVSVLKRSAQNILQDIDEVYKNMYSKKLNFN